ncbi:sugar ABC transporter permease [Lachnospiraceae bacterium]|nr:sugar ABC transporter permease [Lachnospiraceae bacterium]GKH41837.1 sugar ABC transporter permease [Lachnospiraceae bacterium]GKH54458.1 sugar ABC transporter permease [Lachnospiraceae bacterium]
MEAYAKKRKKPSGQLGMELKKDWKRNKVKYIMLIPVVIYFVLFSYKPMYGLIIAFKDFRPGLGIMDSPWVGLDNFEAFLKDVYFWRLLRNTLSISVLQIIFGFPIPIIFALFLNELKGQKFKKTVQTVSYLPHFISIVIVCGIVKVFVQSDGLLPSMMESAFGIQPTNWLTKKELFYPIYIISGIWQNMGWDSIIYLAALAGIDQEQYEAAKIDGAGRFQQMWYVTLPGIIPTVMIMFILRMGTLLSVGYEKILLLYTPTTYEVADVISTYVYRRGLLEADYSYSTAISMFNSIFNVIFLLATNKISKKMSGISLY